MRTIFNGSIQFSLFNIPVKVYGAVKSDSSIKFNQINRKTGNTISYLKVDKETREEVTPENIIKGYQFDKDQYVTFEPEELKQIKVQSSKVIKIQGFVDPDQINKAVYDTPYLLGGNESKEAFSLFREALKQSGKIAIGSICFRDKETPALIALEGNQLMLFKVRFIQSLVEETPPQNETGAVNPEQLSLAVQLIESMTGELGKFDITDNYQGELNKLVQAKIAGTGYTITAIPEATEPANILDALKEAIRKAS